MESSPIAASKRALMKQHFAAWVSARHSRIKSAKSMKRFTRSIAKMSAPNSQALKIGEVAKESGIGIEALRFYEKSGLLDAPSRTDSGYRIYDREVLTRLDFIKRAQLLGFSLDEIKRIITHKRAGQSPCAEVREVVRQRLQELDQRMREMRRYRKELVSALEEWDEMGDVAGHVCGLIEGSRIEHAANSHVPPSRRKK
jgi:MerR family transcriptional regulator, copper efflux regulator